MQIDLSRTISKITSTKGIQIPLAEYDSVLAGTAQVLLRMRKASDLLAPDQRQKMSPHVDGQLWQNTPVVLLNSYITSLVGLESIYMDLITLDGVFAASDNAEAKELIKEARVKAKANFLRHLRAVITSVPCIKSYHEFAARERWMKMLQESDAKLAAKKNKLKKLSAKTGGK